MGCCRIHELVNKAIYSFKMDSVEFLLLHIIKFQSRRWYSSRDLLYNIVLIVNNTVLYNWKSLKRVNRVCFLLPQLKKNIKGEEQKSIIYIYFAYILHPDSNVRKICSIRKYQHHRNEHQSVGNCQFSKYNWQFFFFFERPLSSLQREAPTLAAN